MKKTILVLLSVFAMTLAIVSCGGNSSSVAKATFTDKSIENANGANTITATVIDITLTGDTFKTGNNFKGDDWVADLPEGVTATAALDTTDSTNSKAKLTISGANLKINAAKKVYNVVIPKETLTGGKDITATGKLDITISNLPGYAKIDGTASFALTNGTTLPNNPTFTIKLYNGAKVEDATKVVTLTGAPTGITATSAADTTDDTKIIITLAGAATTAITADVTASIQLAIGAITEKDGTTATTAVTDVAGEIKFTVPSTT